MNLRNISFKMKKLFIALLGVVAITFNVHAQKKSGAIQYETQIDPAAMAAASGFPISDEMKARMPKSVKANYELLFNATNASYMPVEENEDSNGGGRMNMGRMMMRFGGGSNRDYYYSFADQKVFGTVDLNDTTFAIPAKLTVDVSPMGGFNGGGNRQGNENANSGVVQFLPGPPTVEIIKSDETKKILNFNCNKVTIKSTRKAKILDMEKDVIDETVLWYTNDLGFNFSPNPNMWTEGVVLAIENKGGGTVAKSIDFRGVSNKDVNLPKKAVVITPEQYQQKMEAMMKRMRNNNNRGGQGGAPNRTVIN